MVVYTISNIGFLEDIINSGSLGNSSVTYNYGGNRTAVSRLVKEVVLTYILF